MIDRVAEHLASIDRIQLLEVLSRLINQLTVAARSFYGRDRAEFHLRKFNEATHRVSGHLRDLCNPKEKLSNSRIAGIVEQLRLLPDAVIENVFAP